MIGLEPPGNVAKDLAEYRRRLFRDLGEGSALALPEVAPLAFFEAHGRPSRERIGACLGSLWSGSSGSFATEGVAQLGGLFYLRLRGPLRGLSEASAAAFGEMGMLEYSSPPFEPGLGFFLFGPGVPEANPSSLPLPPELSFKDCSLVAMGLRWKGDPLLALTWRELSRSKRRTGPSPLPSRRRRE